jgi:quinol monooxygenase YgiN
MSILPSEDLALPYRLRLKRLPSQKEAGALRYDVYEEPDPHLNHFTIVAAWTNEKAYEDHEAAPYTKQFRAAISQTGKGNLYDQRIYKIAQ